MKLSEKDLRLVPVISAPCCSKATSTKFDMDALRAKINNVGVQGVDLVQSSRETIIYQVITPAK